jgi:hypothetical protein
LADALPRRCGAGCHHRIGVSRPSLAAKPQFAATTRVAGRTTNAEALSGLGRAFITPEHGRCWVALGAVYSEATVKLIAGAVGEMARDERVGRSEAMRRSMLALIDKGANEEAYRRSGPRSW